MINLLIYILIVVIVLGLLFYIVQLLPLPHPFGQIARVVLIVIGVLIVIFLLLDLLPGGGRPRLGSVPSGAVAALSAGAAADLQEWVLGAQC